MDEKIVANQRLNNRKQITDKTDAQLQGKDSRLILLQQAGVFAEDNLLAQLRFNIYEERGRPEVDDGGYL